MDKAHRFLIELTWSALMRLDLFSKLSRAWDNMASTPLGFFKSLMADSSHSGPNLGPIKQSNK